MGLREKLRRMFNVFRLGYMRQNITELYADGRIDCKEYLQRIKELDEK